MTTRIGIPDLCLVTLVGVSGSGKSTWAARHFQPTQVVSSDFCRGLVADDETDQSATEAAFAVLHTIVEKRLEAGRLTVVDATNVRPEDRRPLVELARRQHVLPVAIVIDVPPEICHERNAPRPERDFGRHVVRNQRNALRRSLSGLQREGFRRVYVLRGRDIEDAVVELEARWTDRRALNGPFDIIGDVHGCHDELVALLRELGWSVTDDATRARHPDGRTVVFLGDLVDRGPAVPSVLRLAMNMVTDGVAICIPGNHENKLKRALDGRDVTISHGLAESLAQLAEEPAEFRADVVRFIDGLISHFVLANGELVVAHAGLPETMHNRASAAVRAFSLYGDTTGETDEYGLPVRYPWAEDYRGRATVVYGHTPVPDPVWVNNTLCIDTGCVFGGRLTALRWPERELVSVDAAREYYEPTRPIATEQAPHDRERWELDLDDVLGKRIITTRLNGTVTIREENSAAALEVMSRFAVEPRWLMYLPPTMAPSGTTEREGLLEHPAEAFADFRREGVRHLVCEEKHMGSRAVAVVCRDAAVAVERFGVEESAVAGVIYTRTGRAFFPDGNYEAELLARLRGAIDRVDLWDELDTSWLILDCELMPWSVKAQELLRRQYASVGASATTSLSAEAKVYDQTAAHIPEAAALAEGAHERARHAEQFVDAYRHYCWTVNGVEDLAVAPFQILASEGHLRALQPHPWHLEVVSRLADADPKVIRTTRAFEVDLDDPDQEIAAIEWWEQLTENGGEGMVIKPRDVIATTTRGISQPGIKCRGPEYLRIIYGAEYTTPHHLDRLRQRGLGHKRSLAIREYALGIEALERCVAREPLHRIHECVFGVLALESEPVDPRL